MYRAHTVQRAVFDLQKQTNKQIKPQNKTKTDAAGNIENTACTKFKSPAHNLTFDNNNKSIRTRQMHKIHVIS